MDVRGISSLLDRLACAVPGRELATVLDGLDQRGLTGDEAAAVLLAQRRQAAHYQAGSLDTMIELGLRDETEPGGRRAFPGQFAAEEPRALLRLTKTSAETEFWTGWALHSEFPDVMNAFRAGALDWPRARLFPDVLINLTPDQINLITSRVLPDAPGLTTGQLRARLQREAMAIDPAWRKRAYRERVANRHVHKTINADGTADLAGRDMPLDGVAQSMANLTRLARQAKQAGDPRPLDVIRADLYIGYLTGSYQQVNDNDIIADLLLHATTQDGQPDPPDEAPQQHLVPEDAIHPEDRPDPSNDLPDDPHPRGGRAPLPRRPKPPLTPTTPGTPNPSTATGQPGTGPMSGVRPMGGAGPTGGAGPKAAGSRAPLTGVRPRAGYEVRVKLSTLLGLDDHPGEIPGCGPVDAELARVIVAQHTRGHWRYAYCDHDGYLLQAGVIHARPTGALTYAPPVTGAIVEIALTDDLLHLNAADLDRLDTSDLDRPDPCDLNRAGRARHHTGGPIRGSGAGAGAWAPVIADIVRKLSKPPTAHTPGQGPPAGMSAQPPPVGMPGRRLPGEGLRRRVQVRHRTCVAPGCRKPAADCEIDHRIDYAKGGATVEANLQPVCKWHHRMKHTAGWRLTTLDQHTFRWTTPNGNHIDVRPPPIIDNLPPPMPRE
ncbi:MAG: hypothetical protein GEV11_13765 [Streptosporangiales bacterium]|nr:hypothetical protein [Streptosporangiales bacterium]